MILIFASLVEENVWVNALYSGTCFTGIFLTNKKSRDGGKYFNVVKDTGPERNFGVPQGIRKWLSKLLKALRLVSEKLDLSPTSITHYCVMLGKFLTSALSSVKWTQCLLYVIIQVLSKFVILVFFFIQK